MTLEGRSVTLEAKYRWYINWCVHVLLVQNTYPDAFILCTCKPWVEEVKKVLIIILLAT
jgi:hypothetical protein